MKPLSYLEFEAAVERVVVSRNGCRHDGWYDLQVDTPAGVLEISACESAVTRGAGKNTHWVACRFRDVKRAARQVPNVNPFSGKWNFHGNSACEALEQFESALARLFASIDVSGASEFPRSSPPAPCRPCLGASSSMTSRA
jgi:hypothetical protein